VDLAKVIGLKAERQKGLRRSPAGVDDRRQGSVRTPGRGATHLEYGLLSGNRSGKSAAAAYELHSVLDILEPPWQVARQAAAK
jgi:hypothetical protein